MDKYVPKVGDLVRAELFFKVTSVEFNEAREKVGGDIKLGDAQYYVSGVPLAAVEPFDPNREAELTSHYQSERRQ